MKKTGDSHAKVLAFAINNKRVLLTQNRRHFIKFHLENRNHNGMIVCSEDRDSNKLVVECRIKNAECRMKKP